MADLWAVVVGVWAFRVVGRVGVGHAGAQWGQDRHSAMFLEIFVVADA